MTALMDKRMEADAAQYNFRSLVDAAEQAANRAMNPDGTPVDPETNPKIAVLVGLLDRQVQELGTLRADLLAEFGGVEGFMLELDQPQLDMNPWIKEHIQSSTSLTFDGLDNFMPHHLDFIANARREMTPIVPMNLTIKNCPAIMYGNLMSLDGTQIHLDFKPQAYEPPPMP